MIRRCLFALALSTAFGAITLQSHAQALPAATRGGLLQVGGTYTNANTDEFTQRITGFTAYATYDLTNHFGVEADLHFLDLITPHDFAENSYMIGPRYVYRHGRFEPYGKLLVGIGSTKAQSLYGNAPGTPGSYGAFAFGGGLDIHFSHHLQVRAIDYEYQMWPGFPPNGLTPTMISVGAAYRFH
jgi:hypothetical protein